MTSLDPKNTIDFSISDFTEYSYVLDGVSEAYSTELPESYRHCVAGCTQMNYRGDHCTVALVLFDGTENTCYHANMDHAEILTEEEVVAKWNNDTAPTQFKVLLLNSLDARHE